MNGPLEQDRRQDAPGFTVTTSLAPMSCDEQPQLAKVIRVTKTQSPVKGMSSPNRMNWTIGYEADQVVLMDASKDPPDYKLSSKPRPEISVPEDEDSDDDETREAEQRSKRYILQLLEKHSRGRVVSIKEKQRYRNNIWLACRLATWVVIFGLPVIVYPMSIRIRDWSARGAKYMKSYGLALSNFCWVLGPSLGVTIRYAVEAIIGQSLALANIMFLNWAFDTYMTGGAYSSRQEAVDLGGGTSPIWQSSWLPLCNLGYGPRFVTTNSTAEFMMQCGFNIHWESVDINSLKVAVVVVNLTLFVFLFLQAGFGLQARLYALNYLVVWVMMFVNPAEDGFSESPSLPWIQSIMTGVGSVVVVFAQVCPCPVTALSKAEAHYAELLGSFSVLFEAFPKAACEEVNLKMTSVLQATEIQAADLSQELEGAWWEDMELGSRGRRRRKLQKHSERMIQLRSHMSIGLQLAQGISASESRQLRKRMPSVKSLCECTASAMSADHEGREVQQALLDLENATANLRQDFTQARDSLPPSVLIFLTILSCLSGKMYDAVKDSASNTYSNETTLCGWFGQLSDHMELRQARTYPSHLRFTLRSTAVIILSFLFGWIGLERALNAYEAEAAVTVCIVVANTTGAGFSLALILKRLNSAVIGVVIGQAVGQVLAVQTEFHATLFSVFLFAFSAICIFLVLQSKEHSRTVLPVYAIGVFGLVPTEGIFREYNATMSPAANVELASNVKAAVFGGMMMLIVDFLFYSSARQLIQDRVVVALDRYWDILCLRMVGVSPKSATPSLAALEEDIVEIRRLLPQAISEPAAGVCFPHMLFEMLAASLQDIFLQLGALDLVFSDQHPTLQSLFDDVPETDSRFEKALSELTVVLGKWLRDSHFLLDDLFSRNFQPADVEEASSMKQLRDHILERSYRPSVSSSPKAKPRQSMLDRQITTVLKERSVCSCCKRRKDLKRVAAMPQSQSIDLVVGFQQVLDESRALSHSKRGETPNSDRMSKVELVVYLLQKMNSHFQTINTAIAEQG